jgi:hypothetical protein
MRANSRATDSSIAAMSRTGPFTTDIDAEVAGDPELHDIGERPGRGFDAHLLLEQVKGALDRAVGGLADPLVARLQGRKGAPVHAGTQRQCLHRNPQPDPASSNLLRSTRILHGIKRNG